MKILIISDEAWNDSTHGNNVLTNWFDGFDAEFANVYCSSGYPENKCCDRYFQITDKMMVNSILKGKKAGRLVQQQKADGVKYARTDMNVSLLKRRFPNVLRFLKELVWKYGKYDTELLKSFIDDFSPDIIFTPRFAKRKILRIERIVQDMASCPMVAFTGDNEYSFRMFSLSPLFWYNKLIQHHSLKKMFGRYALYYTLSDEQKEEYERVAKCPVKILRKCGNFEEKYTKRPIHTPIQMVYAGKTYCNRYKTLLKVAEALERLNPQGDEIQLHIYTSDTFDSRVNEKLNNGKTTFVHGSVPATELKKILKASDMVLHVESFDLKHRLETRVSFSTKIIDCLESGAAVMAICWDQHSGYTYLKRNDAAICIDNPEKVYETLERILHNKEILSEYGKKAYLCGKKYHTRQRVQTMLKEDFEKIIKKHRKQSLNVL